MGKGNMARQIARNKTFYTNYLLYMINTTYLVTVLKKRF